MNVRKLVKEHYEIGRIIDVKETTFGSGKTVTVKTESDKYIAKLNNKTYEIEIYNRIQRQLLLAGINQPKVIQTKSGGLIGPQGLVMYQYMQGETFARFDKDMEIKALRYIFTYNQELKKVDIDESELLIENDWDRIRSLDYICHEAPQRIIDLKIDEKWEKVLLEAIELLSDDKGDLVRLDKQLIHSDLGASNFLVLNSEISAVLDFTPEINHELYALAHFVYWNYIWDAKSLEKPAIDFYFNNYYRNNSLRKETKKDFYLLFLQASIRRVLGPLFEIANSETQDYRRLGKRIEIVKWIKKELI